MDANDVREACHQLKFTSGLNIRYHQILCWRWSMVDKAIRIAMGVTSVIAMCLSVSGKDYEWYALAVGWASLCVAVALNIVPTGDYEKANAEMFHKWSDLYKQSQMILKRFEMGGGEIVSDETKNRIEEAIETENSLHAEQTAPFQALLKQCESDELQAIYGVRDFDAAHKKVDAMRRVSISPFLPAAEGPAAAVATE